MSLASVSGAARRAYRRCLTGSLLAALTILTVGATENGGSVYPVGVETVLPGVFPAAGKTMVLEFNTSYQANKLVDSNGHDLIPGFHLRIAAIAVRIMHNWGVPLWGGTLVSTLAVPLIYQHLNGPFGKGNKTGLSNLDLGVAAVSYTRGSWNWWYGLDVATPGFGYHKNDLVNIGQHNIAVVPAGAFTWLPNKGKTEISSRIQEIVNFANPATNYRSGAEFTWEFDAMRNTTKTLAGGVNGFYYQQTTDDTLNGLRFNDGHRGRDLAIGPELRYLRGRYALIAKYFRDTLVENRTVGNTFWFEVGLKLGRPEP